jgi:hypothetical protein
MDCDECQENLSFFFDNELDAASELSVKTHLWECAECALFFEEFTAILNTCRVEDPADIVPPNSKALWCRISNTIEGEIKSAASPEPVKQESWFARGIRFSVSQAGAVVAGVALISSLLTIVAIRNYIEPPADDFTSRSGASQTTFEKILARVGLSDSPQEARQRRLKEQHSAIEYWDKRVQARRAQWDQKMRDAFDRNLHEINQAVAEYTTNLERNPQDDLSGEMLDSAMNEKVNLLRAFSEL